MTSPARGGGPVIAARKRASMPNTPLIKIGVLGGGMIAQVRHLPFYLGDPRCDVVRLAETRPSLIAALGERLGAERIVGDHRDLFEMQSTRARKGRISSSSFWGWTRAWWNAALCPAISPISSRARQPRSRRRRSVRGFTHRGGYISFLRRAGTAPLAWI